VAVEVAEVSHGARQGVVTLDAGRTSKKGLRSTPVNYCGYLEPAYRRAPNQAPRGLKPAVLVEKTAQMPLAVPGWGNVST